MTKKSKYATAITDANGGIHSVRQLKQAQDRLRNNPYHRPILVHMVLTGFDSKAPYQKAIKAIREKLVDYGCPTDYFAAWENDVGKWKSLHVHVFFLIETLHRFPKAILRITDGGWLHKMADKWGMNRPHISKPKNTIHRKGSLPPFFARPIDGERLEDCCDWISYGYKNRSKEALPFREVYANSTFKANDVKRQQYLDALVSPVKPAEVEADELFPEMGEKVVLACSGENPPAEASQQSYLVTTKQSPIGRPSTGEDWLDPWADEPQVNDSKGTSMTLTAAQKFLASLYERAVDLQLDTEQMRKYMLRRGVKRTPMQLEDELENMAGFYGYAASHRPQPAMSVAEWDRLASRGMIGQFAQQICHANLPAPH